MAVKYNTSAIDEVINIVKNSVTTLDSEMLNSISSDFSAFTELGLFSTQLSKIIKDAGTLKESQESFITLLNSHKNDWGATVEEANNEIKNYAANYYSGGTRNTSGGSRYSGGSNTGSYSGSKNTVVINSPVKISTKEVSDFVSKIDNTTMPILLRKIYQYKKSDESIIDLLINQSKSGVLLTIMRKVLGDTSDEASISDEEATKVQKAVLQKVNTEKVDVKTEEGASQLEKKVLQEVKTKTSPADEEKWNKLVYGDGKVKKVTLLDGTWVVADTKLDLQSYASYIMDGGVRQNSDTDKYSDYCLAFSYVHAYDLYNGTQGTAEMAGNYAHAGAFEDYINDDKASVMQKIYSEIMNGRPVVLQVNGNKAGTSRHFVTVVGFKDGITDPTKLTEKDLLIIDSWDGKIERMDTSTSRFMTTGAQCKKDYSGYRLRVLKTANKA